LEFLIHRNNINQKIIKLYDVISNAREKEGQANGNFIFLKQWQELCLSIKIKKSNQTTRPHRHPKVNPPK
jgi:hypothetical protein